VIPVSYDDYEVLDQIWLIGASADDWLSFPETLTRAITERQTQKEQISPKAGVIWVPVKNMTLRVLILVHWVVCSMKTAAAGKPSQVADSTRRFEALSPSRWTELPLDRILRRHTLTFMHLPTGTTWPGGSGFGATAITHLQYLNHQQTNQP